MFGMLGIYVHVCFGVTKLHSWFIIRSSINKFIIYRVSVMPLPIVTEVKKPRHATAKDVRAAAAVGDAVFAYFEKHGRFPTSREYYGYQK